MNFETTVATVLGVAAALAMARTLWRQQRAESASRSRGWRVAALLLAQPLIAALLYFALFPPRLPGQAGTLAVAAAGASDAAWREAAGEVRVVLPEASRDLDGERVPDLATALRRYPQSQRLRVVGAGLIARDRDAVRGIAVDFAAAPLPRGIVGAWAPARIGEGETFAVRGRVEGANGGAVELLDPAGQRVDRAALVADGTFALDAVARVAGRAGFALRAVDAQQREIERVALPVSVEAEPPVRVLLLAGAPGPELKYLRRWASDSGLKLHTQIATGAGMQLGDAPLRIDAPTLAGFDALVIDERAWDALAPAQRAALAGALRGGLGVLLRATGPLSPGLRAQLREFGLEPGAGADTATLRLPVERADEAALRARLGPGSADAPRSREQAPPALPTLTRRALALDAPALQALGVDADGKAFAAWRAAGQGRIAVWGVSDSFRLVLAGREDAHARLWSRALSALARPRAVARAEIDSDARVGERVRLCGVGAQAQVVASDGARIGLSVDPAAGPKACAGFWPTSAGWHSLEQGERRQDFYVRAADEAPGLRARELRDATAALALRSGESSATATASASQTGERGSPWRWFAAWLTLCAALWWFERSRFGRAGGASGAAASDPPR
ncbi:carboxypeptidase regulatory-like domain-containing protein [Lysobacter sp. K5869]|uniref:carboxypeptidase regulatory-like domain-containing protein n=1 Tax=Lysobacter sp. K5869 TaxID=2820808 RepID=UPI001C0636AA|nr:carboxypeptidase regulatory-like domain-containing protein [Lysobacter sp. K5869]QWP75236.1 carboxypeptidase regulatory-like domain-containing protein [Lysobacter sp. K5869]